MAHITGTSFELIQEIAPISGLANLETAVIDGTRFVYASRNFAGSDVQVYTVADDGTLTYLAEVADTASIALGGAWGTNTFTLGGTTYLAVAGQQDDGVSVFAMRSTAPYLEHIDSLFDSDSVDFDLDEARFIGSHQIGDDTFLTIGGRSDIGSVTTLRVASDGTLSFAAKYEGDPETGEIGASVYRGWPSDLFEVGGTHYFMLTDPWGVNWSIMSIDPDTGELELAVEMAGFDVTRFDSSGQGTVHIADGVPYLFVPSTMDSAVYVYTYAGGDDVIPVTSISIPGQLDGVAKSQIYVVGDKIILGVGSAQPTNGVTLFEFDLATETLVELQWLKAVDGAPDEQLLNDVTFGPTNYDVDGKPYAMIMGDNDAALNVYAIGGGDDVLVGTVDADLIEGFGGNDMMTGLNGNDIIRGFDGNDSLFGNRGDDDLSGGAGDDYIEAGQGDDLVNGGAGVDEMLGFGGIDEIHGGDGDDIIKGGSGADQLNGDAGNDEVLGGSGSDTVFGQDGDDFMNGGAGNDTMNGGADNDRMFGGLGKDNMDGGDGDDLLKGNEGDDTLIGGIGNDTLSGQAGDDNLSGNAGNDILEGGSGRDLINGGAGDDVLTGGTAVDTFVFDTVATTGGGFNQITDFTNGVDLLDLTAYGYGDAASAFSGASQIGADVSLTLNDGQVILLDNILLADLDDTDLVPLAFV